MIDLAKLKSEIATAAEARAMSLKGFYFVAVVGNLTRDSSHQFDPMPLLESEKSESEIASEVIGLARNITEADSPDAIAEENAALRKKLAVAEVRERAAAALANRKEPPPIPHVTT